MTDCSRWTCEFSSIKRKKIIADFAGGNLTCDAGVLLPREVDKRIGLIDALAECLSDTRQKSKVVHSLRSLLAQRIFAIAAGARVPGHKGRFPESSRQRQLHCRAICTPSATPPDRVC